MGDEEETESRFMEFKASDVMIQIASHLLDIDWPDVFRMRKAGETGFQLF